jgi:thiosulfate dehydrogenase [quinone] large subunit
MNTIVQIPEPKLSKMLFGDTRFSWLWLVIRLYVGAQWFMAGWGKLFSPEWTGDQAGVAIQKFLEGAVAKSVGAHPAVSGWYSSFLTAVPLQHTELFSHLIVWGELLVGAALILGLFTGIASFIGVFMNFNFLFAGAVSSNPILVILQLFLILGWRTAGWIGLDHWLLPKFGTPWYKDTTTN